MQNPEDMAQPSHAAEASARAFVEHAGSVARFIRGLGVRPRDLDDLVQQVFLSAHEKGGYRPGEASERTWLLRLAWYAVISHRRQQRRATMSDTEAEPWSEAPQPRTVEARERLTQVQRAMQTMPDEHRATLLLFDVQGFSAKEVAQALEVPVGTVHSRLHGARRKLAAALAKLAEEAEEDQR